MKSYLDEKKVSVFSSLYIFASSAPFDEVLKWIDFKAIFLEYPTYIRSLWYSSMLFDGA